MAHARTALSTCSVLLLVAAADSYKLPDFSWETLPVAWHSAVPAKELAAADLAVLRRYPLVTLEKTTGAETLHWDPSTLKWRVPITCQVGNDAKKCGCCQEDNFIRHAAQLKAANPRQMIIGTCPPRPLFFLRPPPPPRHARAAPSSCCASR